MSHKQDRCKIILKKTSIRTAMLRRSHNLPARYNTWSSMQQEADSMAVVLAFESEDWSTGRTQIGDSDSEVDYLDLSPTVEDVVPDTVPVTGESFCRCDPLEEVRPGELQPLSDCLCGEEDQGFDWVWDERSKSSSAFLSCDNRKVSFHSEYSCGTAAIRGTKELGEGQHFWEIKMTSPVYGTDMMVGIGTAEVSMEKYRHSFCSMLGTDEDSWGLSYTGLLQHKGDKVNFSSRFGQGSIIGLHLDTWHGTLTFYKNRHRIGVAATRLQNKKFYPMVCSTAARSSMKVIRSCYTPTSLQYLCCARLHQQLPNCPDTLGVLPLPPGLRQLLHTQLGWVFSLNNQTTEGLEQPGDFSEEASPPPSPCTSPMPILSACSYPSSTPSPTPDPIPCLCPCQLHHRAQACSCPPTPPETESDGCLSEPEDYQSKRCRWT